MPNFQFRLSHLLSFTNLFARVHIKNYHVHKIYGFQYGFLGLFTAAVYSRQVAEGSLTALRVYSFHGLIVRKVIGWESTSRHWEALHQFRITTLQRRSLPKFKTIRTSTKHWIFSGFFGEDFQLNPQAIDSSQIE